MLKARQELKATKVRAKVRKVKAKEKVSPAKIAVHTITQLPIACTRRGSSRILTNRVRDSVAAP